MIYNAKKACFSRCEGGWRLAAEFNCLPLPWCAYQRGTRPSRSEALPCDAGLRSSLPAVWSISPAHPDNVFLWSRTSAREDNRLFILQCQLIRTCLRTGCSSRWILTWGSLCSAAIFCKSRRDWFTLFSSCKAHSRASRPLPHSSLSGF